MLGGEKQQKEMSVSFTVGNWMENIFGPPPSDCEFLWRRKFPENTPQAIICCIVSFHFFFREQMAIIKEINYPLKNDVAAAVESLYGRHRLRRVSSSNIHCTCEVNCCLADDILQPRNHCNFIYAPQSMTMPRDNWEERERETAWPWITTTSWEIRYPLVLQSIETSSS